MEEDSLTDSQILDNREEVDEGNVEGATEKEQEERNSEHDNEESSSDSAIETEAYRDIQDDEPEAQTDQVPEEDDINDPEAGDLGSDGGSEDDQQIYQDDEPETQADQVVENNDIDDPVPREADELDLNDSSENDQEIQEDKSEIQTNQVLEDNIDDPVPQETDDLGSNDDSESKANSDGEEPDDQQDNIEYAKEQDENNVGTDLQPINKEDLINEETLEVHVEGGQGVAKGDTIPSQDISDAGTHLEPHPMNFEKNAEKAKANTNAGHPASQGEEITGSDDGFQATDKTVNQTDTVPVKHGISNSISQKPSSKSPPKATTSASRVSKQEKVKIHVKPVAKKPTAQDSFKENSVPTKKASPLSQRSKPNITEDKKRKTKFTPTKVKPFNFASESRAENRRKYDERIKHQQAVEQERERLLREQKEKEEKLAIAEHRKSLVHKARPIAHYNAISISPSKSPLTVPQGPNLVIATRDRSQKCNVGDKKFE